MTSLSHFIITIIAQFGYAGIALAMAIESASIPLPSEIIMPFSGFLVAQGQFNLWLVALAGGFGCLLGSLATWWIGARFGEEFIRALIKKYGKFILVFEYELDEAIEWFNKRGEAITFFSRFLPVIRTFISLPAGIAKMDFKRFAVLTFIGSLIWSYTLAWIGMKLGQNWEVLGSWFHRFDFAIVALGLLAGLYYVYHKIKKHRKHQAV